MAYPITFAQDIIRCALCENSGDYLCKPCQLNLCCACTSRHLSDKSNAHEIVEFTSQSKPDIFECSSHDKYLCEIYCRDCNGPICTKCVTSDHRHHNFIPLEDFLEEEKAEVFIKIQEIESIVLPEFQKQKRTIDEKKYENTIEAITAQEDMICNAVRETGSKLREHLTRKKKENIETANKNCLEKKEIVKVIQETKMLLARNNPKEILEFEGIKCQITSSPTIVNKRGPVFQVKNVQEGDVSLLFGTLVNIKDKNDILGGENLKKETWFHGHIPLKEAHQLLKRNGDFLVREMVNNPEQVRFVISMYENGFVHFNVQPKSVLSRIGQNATLVDFINHLVTTGEPLSNCNPFALKYPVDRTPHQLDYDQITLGTEIQMAQRKDTLFKGSFRDKAVLVSSDDDKEYRMFKNVKFLRCFDHPNIVRLEGYSALWKPVFLLLEDMSGQLLTFLRMEEHSTSNKEKTEMCLDVAKAMAYLHHNKVIFRDVAARNCLVSDSGVVKIHDFSESKTGDVYHLKEFRKKNIPMKWTAPETLVSGNYTYLSDVWSFGVLMWEIFSSGQSPYPGLTNKETIEQVLVGYRMTSPENTPKPCYNLMLKCWEKNFAKRFHFQELVKKLQTINQKLK